MKQEKLLPSKIKVGAKFYKAGAYEWEGKIYTYLETFEVKNIKRPRRTPIQIRLKRELPKALDVRCISCEFTKGFDISITDESLPWGVYNTELKALEYAVHSENEDVTRYKDNPDWEEETSESVRCLKALKTRLTKFKNARKKRLASKPKK